MERMQVRIYVASLIGYIGNKGCKCFAWAEKPPEVVSRKMESLNCF
jgi:hypothetical protein